MVCDFHLAQESHQNVNGCFGAGRRASIVKNDLIKLLLYNDPTEPPEIGGLGEDTQTNVK